MEQNTSEVISIASKALINLIPYAGGSISSIISDYQSYRKDQKIKEFLDSISSKLQQHENMISNISQDYILCDDFFDIFENSLRKVIYERQQEKRIAYSNILANSIVNGTDYNVTELYQHLVDILSPLHIRLLKEFSYHTQTKDEVFDVFLGRIMSAIKALYDSEETVIEVIQDLESNNLLHPFLRTHATRNGAGGLACVTENFVTAKGYRFLDFIC